MRSLRTGNEHYYRRRVALLLRDPRKLTRYFHGDKEAEVQLKKAIELDPDFAAPHFVLGDVNQATKRRPEAIKEYGAFLALAAMNYTRREEADQMAAMLRGSE